jgi:hypothetical protein
LQEEFVNALTSNRKLLKEQMDVYDQNAMQRFDKLYQTLTGARRPAGPFKSLDGIAPPVDLNAIAATLEVMPEDIRIPVQERILDQGLEGADLLKGQINGKRQIIAGAGTFRTEEYAKKPKPVYDAATKAHSWVYSIYYLVADPWKDDYALAPDSIIHDDLLCLFCSETWRNDISKECAGSSVGALKKALRVAEGKPVRRSR